jgi:hypothetical protein
VGENKFATKKLLKDTKVPYKPPDALNTFTAPATALCLLDVSGSPLPITALTSIVAAVKSVKQLDGSEFTLHVARCELGVSRQATALLAGAAAIMGSLTELVLDGNDFSDSELASLLHSLADNSTLRTLGLDKCIPSRSAGRDASMPALVALLEAGDGNSGGSSVVGGGGGGGGGGKSGLTSLSIAECHLKRARCFRFATELVLLEGAIGSHACWRK